jgi:predicted AAA+ superfamily ATPase
MTVKDKLENISIETILAPYNPWWKTGDVETEDFKRPIFHKIFKDLLNLKQIISITGPRRVGKTTLLKQIIQSLILEQNIEPPRIIYFSFDDPLLAEPHLREHFFDRLIQWADLNHSGKIVYFFLDEIQKFDRWELYLKKYYDLNFPARFVISGSASSPIFRKSRESLLGRIKDNHLLPFSFKEFVYFRSPDNKALLDFVGRADQFGHKLQREMAVNWREIASESGPLSLSKEMFDHLNTLLDQYFVEGGFPEAWEIKDFVDKQEYLYDNQVKKVIFEDLVIATEFRKPENIKAFYISLVEQPGQEINIEKTAQKTGISRPMLEKYLPLLEMTDLVKTVPRFSKRPLKFRRGSVKCYLIDLALRNAILKLDHNLLNDDAMMGLYAENLVFNALRQFAGQIELTFYKDVKREIDFVVHLGGKRYLPVEVKYRQIPDDLPAMERFLEEYDQSFGIVVTKSFYTPSAPSGKILFIPLSVFLLFF